MANKRHKCGKESAQQMVQADEAISQEYPLNSCLVIDIKEIKGSHPR